MIFVLDTAIGLGIWIPFTVGKATALLSVSQAFSVIPDDIDGFNSWIHVASYKSYIYLSEACESLQILSSIQLSMFLSSFCFPVWQKWFKFYSVYSRYLWQSLPVNFLEAVQPQAFLTSPPKLYVKYHSTVNHGTHIILYSTVAQQA